MDIYFFIIKQTICFVIFSIKRHITSQPYLNRLRNTHLIFSLHALLLLHETKTRQNNEYEKNPIQSTPKIAKYMSKETDQPSEI